MGTDAWGHRTDLTVVLFKFHEVMVVENSKVEQNDDYGHFIYLSFKVIYVKILNFFYQILIWKLLFLTFY